MISCSNLEIFAIKLQNGVVELLMHTSSDTGLFGNFCDFIANICTYRPIVNCKTALRTAISHSHYDKTWCITRGWYATSPWV